MPSLIFPWFVYKKDNAVCHLKSPSKFKKNRNIIDCSFWTEYSQTKTY